jgi:Double zinc ribbon
MGPDEKKCPFCAEVIKAEAIRCKHCQADLSPPQSDYAPDEIKACPYCMEIVHIDAETCKSCGKGLPIFAKEPCKTCAQKGIKSELALATAKKAPLPMMIGGGVGLLIGFIVLFIFWPIGVPLMIGSLIMGSLRTQEYKRWRCPTCGGARTYVPPPIR